MDLQLQGKRALVTGSSSGIGAGIARVLAREGAMVVVHGRNRERTGRVAEDIRRDGGRVQVATGDLTDDAQAQAVAQAADAAFGGIDILINNAGGAAGKQQQDWLGTSPEIWAATYQTNVISAVRLIQFFIAQMKQRGWGRIIQLASASAIQPLPFSLPDYQASKAAVINFTVGLSKYLGGTGVTVNTITPGTILTPALERTFRDWARARNWGEEWAEVERRAVTEMFPNPSGRVGRIEDIANMAAFIASPLAGFVNGANIRVDGGRVPTIN
ncbi:MAG TPA: SDR family oxidoreductase [Candidatus Binataceae bacterium]|jgi:3-oxoacyl-[acyl-carrier protein] reductase|nr:SDR family oxidoreductase [Candidatus Binataceae bacterium]